MAGGKQGGGDADGERRENGGCEQNHYTDHRQIQASITELPQFPGHLPKNALLKAPHQTGSTHLSPLLPLASLPSCIFASLPTVPIAYVCVCGCDIIIHIIGDDAHWMARRKSFLRVNTFIH